MFFRESGSHVILTNYKAHRNQHKTNGGTMHSIEFAYKFFLHRAWRKISYQSKSPIQLSWTKFLIYFLFLFLQKSQGTTLYFFLLLIVFFFQISSLVFTLTNEISWVFDSSIPICKRMSLNLFVGSCVIKSTNERTSLSRNFFCMKTQIKFFWIPHISFSSVGFCSRYRKRYLQFIYN